MNINFWMFQTCAVVDPDSGFEFNLLPLANKDGYNTTANGKYFLVRHKRRWCSDRQDVCVFLSWMSQCNIYLLDGHLFIQFLIQSSCYNLDFLRLKFCHKVNRSLMPPFFSWTSVQTHQNVGRVWPAASWRTDSRSVRCRWRRPSSTPLMASSS